MVIVSGIVILLTFKSSEFVCLQMYVCSYLSTVIHVVHVNVEFILFFQTKYKIVYTVKAITSNFKVHGSVEYNVISILT